MATIREMGDARELDEMVADAFPGARIDFDGRHGYFELMLAQHGLLRPLTAAELSDGTLRYLLLVAALRSPRPPALMILNDPETSLHPDFLAPMARLVGVASKRSQVIVVTHAQSLVSSLIEERGSTRIVLEKDMGETRVQDHDEPPRKWPER